MTSTDIPDNRPGPYYVSAVDRTGKVCLALGPFAAHADALARVDDVRRHFAANGQDDFADVHYGTVRLTGGPNYGPGKLNADLGVDECDICGKMATLHDSGGSVRICPTCDASR